uniref:ZZ-type domain-containing protein n=1 Tax=Kalanchoe fedtschenkoi TaxID=63787 RepID=A0A7N0TJH4_KALFE
MVVNLKTVNKGGHSNVKASGNSTPMESPRVQQSIENIQAGVEEVVNTVPEPLRGVLLKLTRDFASTASAPVIADIIHSVSKIGESFACQGPQTFAQKESNGQNKASDGESSSGLSGSKSSRAAEVKEEKLTDKLRQVKDKAVDSGFSCVPDLNNAPPPPPRFAAATPASNSTGKRDSRCPMLANAGSSNLNVNPFNECLFSGTQVDARFPASYNGDRGSLFKRSPGHFDSVDSVFHTGVQCDVCGVHPITGPRFKSKVRYNYDLCSLCYGKSGNEADYVRIDSPLLYRHIMKALHRKHGRHGQPFEGHGSFKPVAYPYLPFSVRPASLVNQVKLDSRFILDVNVMDGTVMAPSTRFTKIWRMRNTGNVVWPMGTQLVWTDGDKFSNVLSVDLEIPAFGTPIEGELDVAVDFVAPKLPGEYVSYWRMSSPSGQLFGQRVWVVILVQVDASPDPLSGSFSHLNLNLPPQGHELNEPAVIDINVEPSVNNLDNPSNSSAVVDPVESVAVSSKGVDEKSTTVTGPVIAAEPVVGKPPVEDLDQNLVSKGSVSEATDSARNEQDLYFPTNDTLLVGNVFSQATAPPVVPSVSYPMVDSSNIEVVALPLNASSNVANVAPSPQPEAFHEDEESLLMELCEMGFNQVDLNREILKMNNYDMEQALVDLCEISEWDPIFDELEEMGFSDRKKNAKLLVKNKGSIKRVVMDLVSSERSA